MELKCCELTDFPSWIGLIGLISIIIAQPQSFLISSKKDTHFYSKSFCTVFHKNIVMVIIIIIINFQQY